MNNISISQIGHGMSYIGQELTKSPLSALSMTTKIAGSVFGLYTLYSIYEAAFSDILCLKTFQHGTNPYAHLKISWEGPKYDYAGKGGEARYWKVANEKQSPWAERDAKEKPFYVVQGYLDEGHSGSISDYLSSFVATKVTCKWYALQSTVGFFGQFLPLHSKLRGVVTQKALHYLQNGHHYGDGGKILKLIGLCCPTVKFHVNPDHVTIIPFPAYRDYQVESRTEIEGEIKVKFDRYGTFNYRVEDFLSENKKLVNRQSNKFYIEKGSEREELDPLRLLKKDQLLFFADGTNAGFKKDFEGALATKYRFSPLDIGFAGILKNGINKDLPTRVWEHKKQCLWGVAQLVYAVALTAFVVGYIAPASVFYGPSLMLAVTTFSEMSERLKTLASFAAGIPLFVFGSYTLFQI